MTSNAVKIAKWQSASSSHEKLEKRTYENGFIKYWIYQDAWYPIQAQLAQRYLKLNYFIEDTPEAFKRARIQEWKEIFEYMDEQEKREDESK